MSVLVADGNSGGAWAATTFTAVDEVYVTIDLSIDPTKSNRASIVLRSSGLERGAVRYDSGWNEDDQTGDFSATPAGKPFGQYQTVEFRVKKNTNVQVWVDGTLIINEAFADPVQINEVRVGSAGSIGFEGVALIDNVKIGTTRGGSEIFSDDFESGDLSAWTSVVGAAYTANITSSNITPAYQWTIRHYDIAGDPFRADYINYPINTGAGGTDLDHVVRHATDRGINYVLNGVDDCSFTLYLDDPMAAAITPLFSIIKVWRKITDSETGSTIYEDPEDSPSFAGVVGYAIKDGDSNTMQVKAFSPLWRLQFHFHLLNHYLKKNPLTSLDYKQSELIWKLIDLINNAFGAASFTGIAQGTFDWSGEPTIAPYFVAKGSNTWSNIFDDIMNRVAGSDISSAYYHSDSNPILMNFDTYEKLGSNKAAIINFRFHTGSSDNLENLTEEIQAIPGEFANYVWTVGQGGPNSGKVAVAEDNTFVNYGWPTVGVYMKRVDRSEVKRLPALQPIADAELAQSRWPKIAYNITVSPKINFFYGRNMDYQIGDVVGLTASKGALSVSNKRQRIYQCALAISNNNVETASPLVANDFYGKIVEA